jgi:hypothetical protein
MTGFAALQTMTKVIIENRGWQIFLPAFFVLPALQPRTQIALKVARRGASYPPRRLACALGARRRRHG